LQADASITAVILAMDCLTDGMRGNQSLGPAVLAALKLAHMKMNQYYSLTDLSAVYCITMVLHPGIKLEYFQQQDWDEDWIEEADNLVQEEYISTYEQKGEVMKNTAKSNAKPTLNDFMDFATVSVGAQKQHNKIDQYLRHPVETVLNPLQWWIHNRFVYANLSHMALDYLSIPCGEHFTLPYIFPGNPLGIGGNPSGIHWESY